VKVKGIKSYDVYPRQLFLNSTGCEQAEYTYGGENREVMHLHRVFDASLLLQAVNNMIYLLALTPAPRQLSALAQGRFLREGHTRG
jgi:hypothetical protein